MNAVLTNLQTIGPLVIRNTETHFVRIAVNRIQNVHMNAHWECSYARTRSYERYRSCMHMYFVWMVSGLCEHVSCACMPQLHLPTKSKTSERNVALLGDDHRIAFWIGPYLQMRFPLRSLAERRFSLCNVRLMHICLYDKNWIDSLEMLLKLCCLNC